MIVLNLGCGVKTSHLATNIDWSMYLSIKNNRFLSLLSPIFLSADRQRKLKTLDKDILVHDIRKGLPFDSGSVNVVYHSHMFEHIDREHVPKFLKEIQRVLVPGGIHRIVVPDFEYLCKAYSKHLHEVEENSSLTADHEYFILNIIEQMVRKSAYITAHQSFWRGWLETHLLGDARKRGETHQWMYDRITLPYLLSEVGFQNIKVLSYIESSIPNWSSFELDVDEHGKEYKPHSLYVEAIK